MPEIFNLFFTSDCEYTFFLAKEKDFYQKKRMRKIGVYHFEHRGHRRLFIFFCKQQKNVTNGTARHGTARHNGGCFFSTSMDHSVVYHLGVKILALVVATMGYYTLKKAFMGKKP